jgi:hypothetical protein
MEDIIDFPEGRDFTTADSVVGKARNVLSVQIGSLEYAPDFGVDLKYFLDTQFAIENTSFKAYMIQRLVESGINVSQCIEVIESLYRKYTYYVDDREQGEGLIT